MTISQLLGHLELSPLVEMCTRVLPWLCPRSVRNLQHGIDFHGNTSYTWWGSPLFQHTRKTYSKVHKTQMCFLLLVLSSGFLHTNVPILSLQADGDGFCLFGLVFANHCHHVTQQGVDASNDFIEVSIHGRCSCMLHGCVLLTQDPHVISMGLIYQEFGWSIFVFSGRFPCDQYKFCQLCRNDRERCRKGVGPPYNAWLSSQDARCQKRRLFENSAQFDQNSKNIVSAKQEDIRCEKLNNSMKSAGKTQWNQAGMSAMRKLRVMQGAPPSDPEHPRQVACHQWCWNRKTITR